MKRILIVVAILSASSTVSVVGQQTLPPPRIGADVAGHMMNGPFDIYRVGGQLVIPVGPRLSIYPANSRFLDCADWEVRAALRLRPVGTSQGSSPLYLG